MTIRIYPSRLPGEPLERHEHGTLTLHDWMLKNVKDYAESTKHPIAVELNGKPLPPNEWPLCLLKPESDIKMFPVPYGTGLEIAAWAAIAVAVASAAYSIYMMSTMDKGGGYSSTNGLGLDLNPAKANTAKLGDAIRELFGRYRIYPDYVVQPVTRFDPNDPTRMIVEMLVCLGVGNIAFTNGDIRVGSSPATSLGTKFSYNVFSPGADVSGDHRSENWFNSTEVGGTSSGSGLDMAQTSPDSTDITADSMTVSGPSVTFSGLHDDNNDDEENALPESWVEGALVTITAPANFAVSTSSGFSVLASNTLSELNPFTGMPVTLEINGSEYDLFIATFTPGQDAVPGVGGTASVLRGNAAPTTYDFSVTSQTFTLTWQEVAYTVSLVANYGTMSGLLAAINGGLTGSGLVAHDDGGVVRIVEISSPWRGGSITSSSFPVSVFGDNPDSTSGTASSGGSPAITSNVTLAYGSAAGAAFSGIPEGTQRLSLAHRGNEYRISEADGTTATVQRIIDGAVDAYWPGFSPRTMIDYAATGINDNNTWMGPFLACPENEVVDAFEVNFSFPSGICGFDSKGKKRIRHCEWEIQYRVYGSGTGWTSKQGVYALQNVNGLGFTERIDLDSPGLVEVRCRRRNEQGSNNARDSMFWHALRGRLLARPSSYAGVTLMAATVETGGVLAAQSDRRVSVVGTRIYATGAARSISGALYHVGDSLGLAMDTEAIDVLESTYWAPGSEYFDYATGDSISALEMLQKITNAGKSYFLLSDGLASVGREGVKNWAGIISPHEMTEELQTTFSAPSADDYDGVDVTYINGTTWAEETVQCRTPDNPTPRKVEKYTLDGVLDPNRAYRIGMRRLMKYLHQRLGHTTSTELDALVYQFGDRILLTDDIPGNKTVSSLVVDMSTDGGQTTFSVTEPLDWSFENPRAIVRYQDGSASGLLVVTRVGDYELSVPWQASFDDIVLEDPYIEPPRLIFCNSTRSYYDAIFDEIGSPSDGTCAITARQYSEIFYQYDDAIYPGNVA
ncbi:host specificity factor TipJ family phage tail protein [Raoultella planticola]|uniref:Host specificity factor TipJ family phage tail protein n=1 Tax=Raoultella planticola TaxID=575 RepID=A0ABU5M4H6_RAOPL|nr:host specificity factor TipJ family phage tail protein [Raoultella planticola]MDW4552796.1 host specificity factor TipJ family phage tail protein [Raoultella planticola]MDZ7446255.1 host specificity factor TipJ family phage tail protein [Raoultella planticola]MDZ7467092.1 host specificity factor TipJ family phage tail protein [Raoultella planticola]MDZ7504860.1 host specificity factor TipJ family phage tail protein [Raoultella planticola]MEA5394419.1 host specificity factor TipJ family phag